MTGIRSIPLQIFKSFLSNRMQKCRIPKTKISVQQGIVLGPILFFIIYQWHATLTIERIYEIIRRWLCFILFIYKQNFPNMQHDLTIRKIFRLVQSDFDFPIRKIQWYRGSRWNQISWPYNWQKFNMEVTY